ncbi:hypothetical protein [Olsenella sp. HMSC062G07]|uniref:hypothetical protein n=1 Tax=Olsenella sp. HMSC062G07 TaxID=1739330 RepID=UPI0008A4A0DC|nr:hypothetical protein [Olsenella sp. HMSC062G07]OFK24624.1 hypothetical protein HMPREF2826_06925 [Olsenella sp. HMSC062G07]
MVEDTGATLDDLRAAGISDEVIEAARLLTHDPTVPYMEYVRRIKTNQIARAVKLADLEHNSDLSRLPEVTESDLERLEKYQKAMAELS